MQRSYNPWPSPIYQSQRLPINEVQPWISWGIVLLQEDVFTNGHGLIHVQCNCIVAPANPNVWWTPSKFTPTTKVQQVESEVWILQFGSLGKHQLDVLSQNDIGTPPVFEYHPFCYIDFKEQAYIQKQAAHQWMAERIPTCCAEFYMDFGFMQSSSEDYKRSNKATNRVATSYDGYSSHLVIVMAPLAGFGCSLPEQRNLQLTFSGPLCQNLAWLKV